jgi:Flp pilus assembly pilin Flp
MNLPIRKRWGTIMITTWVRHRVRAILGEEKGISSLEYAVLAVGIVLVVATAASLLGGKVTDIFNTVGSSL